MARPEAHVLINGITARIESAAPFFDAGTTENVIMDIEKLIADYREYLDNRGLPGYPAD